MEMNEMLRRLEGHPAVQALEREDREAAFAERRRLVAEREAILAALAKARPALAKVLEGATAAASRAHEEWRALAGKAYAAEAALASADHSAGAACERIDAQLRATAPSGIRNFVAALDAELEAVRREPPVHVVEAVLNYGDAPQAIGSSYDALRRWLAAAMVVRGKAQALEVEALDPKALEERFAQLRLELGGVPGRASAEAKDPAFEGVLRRKLAS